MMLPNVYKILLALCMSTACMAPASILAQQPHSVQKTSLQPQAVGIVKGQAKLEMHAIHASVGSTVVASEADRSTYAMLLAALVLMAVIAVRRFRSGRP